MTSLKKQTVSGIKWLVISGFIQKIISLCTTIILARLLGPSVFGLFALAFIAIDTLGLFKSIGFDSALIQRKENIEKAANTAFFIIPLLGIGLYLILSLSAPIIGKFLNNQDVANIIRALGIIFVISCLGKVPYALLEKNMQFNKISIIEISTTIVYSATAIIFTVLRWGVWSLVIAYVIKSLNQNILAFIFSKWRPRFEFDKKIALEMFHFGKFLFLGGVVWFLKMNLDNILVGKLLGVKALGLYAIAFNIANFSADYFGGKVHRVSYSTYSKIQNNPEELRSVSLKIFKYVSFIALPIGLGLFVLGGDFLRALYGEKWIEAISVLKILTFSGIFNALYISIGAIFLGCGNSKFGFLVSLLQVAIFISFIVPIANLYGINGVAIIVTIASFLAFLMTMFFVKRILSLTLKQIYLSLKSAVISSISMILSIFFLRNIILQSKINNAPSFNLIGLSIFGVIIYFIVLSRFENDFLIKIKEIVF